MGNYNADSVPNHAQANMLISNAFFLQDRPLYFDQWTIDATNRVNKYCDGKNRINIRIKFNPTLFPT